MAVEVNGELISNAEIREQVAALRAELESPGEQVTLEQRLELRIQAAESLIGRTLLMQEARRLGLTPAAAEIERTAAELSPRSDGVSGCRAGADVAGLRAEAERRLLLDRFLDFHRTKTPRPSSAEVRKHYRANPGSFAAPEMVHVSHLVRNFDGEDRARQRDRISALRERIMAGEDFATLARTESDCPEDGGDLGWFARGTMVEEFEAAVFAARPGTVTEVFETRFGAHLALVHERREAGIRPLEEFAEAIEARLRRQKLDGDLRRLMRKLIGLATIREIP